jgi:FtsP/CotA-like multicopper oxidase with cupredoxin domain
MANAAPLPNPPRPSPRRALARVALGAMLTLALAEPLLAQPRITQAPRVVQGGRLLRIPRGPLLGEPTVVTSVNRLLDAELTVIDTTLNVPSVGNVPLRAYKLTAVNGVPVSDPADFPGPTFRFAPGDSVRIRLVNRLPDDGTDPHECIAYTTHPQDVAPNCFHGSNYTNIHYHGMHVTPDGTGDNVLIEIGPDSTWQFAFRVPMNQSPGTHWYHPHKHGSVALQVTNGMAGSLIVYGGGLDSLTRASNIRDRLIAVQQVDSALNLVIPGKNHGTMLVNGQSNPTVILRPNEVQRWRLVNENVSISTTYQLLFAPVAGRQVPTLFDIARDGVQYAPANYDPGTPDTFLSVAPGNRLDMFVQAPRDTGTFELRAVVTSRPQARNELPFAGARAQGVAQPLLTVRVVNDGAPVQTQLPRALPPLPAFLQNLTTPADTSLRLVFSDSGAKGGQGPSFWLGRADNPRMKFNPDSAFVRLPLGQTQMWRVSNRTPNALNHPFHIHINPFQVLRVVYPDSVKDGNVAFYRNVNQAAANGNPYWMDTFPLPLSNGSAEGYIVIRQKYEDFAGSFVMHCHILGHEERGMMQLIRIVGPGGMMGSAGTGVGDGGSHGPGVHH